MDYSFHGQRENETVIAVIRRHPWSYLKPVLVLVCFLIIPWLVVAIYGFTKIFSLTVLVVIVLSFAWGFCIWYLWNSSLVILTDQRIMVVDVKTPVDRRVIEVPLRNLQNITFENRGFLQTILGYGDVTLQTAGSSESQIILKNLGAPYDVQQLISKIAKL